MVALDGGEAFEIQWCLGELMGVEPHDGKRSKSFHCLRVGTQQDVSCPDIRTRLVPGTTSASTWTPEFPAPGPRWTNTPTSCLVGICVSACSRDLTRWGKTRRCLLSDGGWFWGIIRFPFSQLQSCRKATCISYKLYTELWSSPRLVTWQVIFPNAGPNAG